LRTFVYERSSNRYSTVASAAAAKVAATEAHFSAMTA